MANSAKCESGSATARLTKGLAARDEEAFRRFHAVYFDRLLRYHLVLARGDEHAAHEALQETLLRVVRHARRFEDERMFWSWLTALARSAAVDGGRKRHRYWRLLAGYARSFIRTENATAPSEDADALWHDLLRRTMDELEPDVRRLVEGKYLRRVSVRELAMETGLTEKAVESRLLRARRELRHKVLTKFRNENTV